MNSSIIIETFVKWSVTWKLSVVFLVCVAVFGVLALFNVHGARMLWCIMGGFGIWAFLGANLIRYSYRNMKQKESETS